MFCLWEDVRETRREHGWDSWLARGIFHIIEHHAWYRSCVAGQEGLITAQEWAGHQPAGGKHLCWAPLVSFGFYSSLSPFHCNYYLSSEQLSFVLFQVLNFTWLTSCTCFLIHLPMVGGLCLHSTSLPAEVKPPAASAWWTVGQEELHCTRQHEYVSYSVPISQPTLKITLYHIGGKTHNVLCSSEFIKNSYSSCWMSFSCSKLGQNMVMENDQACPFSEQLEQRNNIFCFETNSLLKEGNINFYLQFSAFQDCRFTIHFTNIGFQKSELKLSESRSLGDHFRCYRIPDLDFLRPEQ